MKKKTILGLVMLVAFTSVLFMNFGDQVGGYMDFAQAEASGSNAHVVGVLVETAPVSYDAASNIFSFTMRDDMGNVRQVRYAKPKPPNFEEAEKLVIEGHSSGNEFIAENILVKCPSKYNDARGLEGTMGS
jgi:cytochrome c-type biogenesis protein CcmE